MPKTKQYVIKGQSEECTMHDWSGCGWADEGHGKVYDDTRAHYQARDMNNDGSDCHGFICWRDEV